MVQFVRLKKAFPALPSGFYDILLDRVKELGFTDARLKDAVNHLIDNFTYPSPSIANIVGFDKRVKLLTYSDMLEEVNKTGRAMDLDHVKVKKNGKLFWISKADKEMYNIPDEF